MQNKSPIIITGPSGAGKTELINYIEHINPKFLEATGSTTRQRRNDDDGKMNFISKKEFEQLIRNDNLIEYTIYNGNYYGVSKDEFKKLDKYKLIFNVGYSSAKIIQQEYIDAIMIYLLPPTKEELLRRLGSREYERYLIGIEETQKNSKYYDYLLISKTNNLKETCNEFMSIVYNDDKSNEKRLTLQRNIEFVENFYK